MAIKIEFSGDDDVKRKRPKLNDLEHLLKKDLGISGSKDFPGSPGIHPKSDLDAKIQEAIKPDSKTPVPATYEKLKDNFEKFCISESSLGENFNTGMYIKMESLENMLQDFKAENNGETHLFIGFGLRRAKLLNGKDDNGKDVKINDWNCFHLLIGAATPSAELDSGGKVSKKPSSTSKLWFSTYDGIESGYTGPKPGCPPFASPEE